MEYIRAILLYRLSVNIATGYSPEFSVWQGFLSTLSVWLPLFVLSLASYARLGKQQKVLGLAWLLTSLAGTAMGGHWLRHYFIQIVPPLCVLAGVGLSAILRNDATEFRVAVGSATAVTLWLFIRADVAYAFVPTAVGARALFHRPAYDVAETAALYLRQHAIPGSSLYVAFYEAEVYHLSGLRSSTPYLFRLDLERIPGAFDAVVSDIAVRKPDWVLDFEQPLAPNLNAHRFYEVLSAGYRVERQFPGASVYKRIENTR
jgi:hypothetical protein